MTLPNQNPSAVRARQGRARHPRARVRDLAGRRIIAEGLERNIWTDLYFNAMTMSWPAFVATLAAAFLALNFVFALIYALGEAPIANAREGSLADLFFFSVETTSTVGYGDMHPQTIYGHVVATAENFTGLLLLAVMTGLVFARFARPRARIIFAKYPVLTQHNGVATLIFRMANARSNFITEATAKLWMLRPTVSEEGKQLVGFERLRLIKSENPTFALSWTLFHPIDEQSPLFGQDEDTLAASESNFVVSIVGFDEASGQMVRARDVFAPRTYASATNTSTSSGSMSRACATSTMRRSTRPDPSRHPARERMIRRRRRGRRWNPPGPATRRKRGGDDALP